MKKIILMLFTASLIWAQQPSVLENLKKILPQGLNINFYEESKIENFYVVNVANNQILYVSNDFKYVFTGDVISLDNGAPSSLNELYQAKLVKQVMSLLEDTRTINFTAENEKHLIKVFTDISCGYCRLLHSQIDDYLALGISIEYYGFPRDGLQTQVFEDMQSAWCSDDPKLSITKLKAGDDVEEKTCQNPIQMHYEYGQLLGITGTPSIFLSNGQKLSGYIPASELIKIIENG
ncbi:MAG: thioredoxin fold domain-containing protein [SAR86 cluster bacterium]|jgi:thiol:disulfide interchange protein DsbC|nr:thioredoxin fold domain-containing protein [SAR86 cluster bacterium]MBL6810704.1 thioredoxin fold domain-containing protein [SAR86 cluster bacterium]